MKKAKFVQIKSKITNALNSLYKNDHFLLENNINERCITNKLAAYLQNEFPYWHVDCEYNRFTDIVKKLDLPKDTINWDDLEAKTIYPDIIIHHRNTNDNLIVIEVKKSNSQINRIFDENKLIAFTKDPYFYQLGILINIYVGSDSSIFPKFKFFKDGQPLDND